MKKKIDFKTANKITNNWAALDPLKNDECIKAFQIRNIIEDSFKAEKDVQKKN